jgi:cytochrome c biogenesis protein CcmG/thiol:disulfide interchange protein DsbE
MTEATSNVAAQHAPRINRKVLLGGAIVALPLLGVLIANLGRDPHAVRSPLIGRAAPEFSLSPVGGGSPVALEGLKGKAVVINFWATWCVPCFQEHAALSEAARSLPDVQFIGVVYEDEEARTAEFLRERPSSYQSLLDPQGRTAIAYGVFGVPETFFIDRGGRIVEKFVGPLDSGSIQALVQRTMDGAP